MGAITMTLKVIIKCDTEGCTNQKGFFSAHDLADQPEWWPYDWVRNEETECDYCPDCAWFNESVNEEGANND